MADMSFDNASYDLIIEGGDLVFTSDIDFPETMRQRIGAKLRTFLGEWFLDDPVNPRVGIPYFQSLFNDKIPTIELADNIFRTALLNIEGVSAVEETAFEYDNSTRVLDFRFRVILIDATTIEDIVNFGT